MNNDICRKTSQLEKKLLNQLLFSPTCLTHNIIPTLEIFVQSRFP
jgi:hypothetical protein